MVVVNCETSMTETGTKERSARSVSTVNNVKTTYGENLGYKGSYANYYVANNVVLVPAYQDPNDSVARDILQGMFPSRTAISIDIRDLYAYGGMIHCVTKQEPLV